MSESAEALARGLSELSVEVAPEQQQMLLDLADLTDAWGQRLNLTGHRGPTRIVERLVLDAAALLGVLPLLASLADLGSGAGYPGLPLAVLCPRLRVTLVESRERRHHFQRAARRALGLENAYPLLGRAEELAAEPHSAAIAQAMARPERALEYMLPWVEPGGWLLLPGAESPPQVPRDRRWLEVEVRRYRVPLGGPDRTLWLGKRR